jgi:hypothetical protein
MRCECCNNGVTYDCSIYADISNSGVANNTPCYSCTTPETSKIEAKPEETNVDSPWDDIKYTLCGYGAQLEYLSYSETPIDVSTSSTAEEIIQYREAIR